MLSSFGTPQFVSVIAVLHDQIPAYSNGRCWPGRLPYCVSYCCCRILLYSEVNACQHMNQGIFCWCGSPNHPMACRALSTPLHFHLSNGMGVSIIAHHSTPSPSLPSSHTPTHRPVPFPDRHTHAREWMQATLHVFQICIPVIPLVLLHAPTTPDLSS